MKTTLGFAYNQKISQTLRHTHRDVIKYFAKKLKYDLLRTEGWQV